MGIGMVISVLIQFVLTPVYAVRCLFLFWPASKINAMLKGAWCQKYCFQRYDTRRGDCISEPKSDYSYEDGDSETLRTLTGSPRLKTNGAKANPAENAHDLGSHQTKNKAKKEEVPTTASIPSER